MNDEMSAIPVGFHRPRLALATLSLVLFLTFLDNTVVSVVLADVQQSLHAGVGALQWVVNGYALVFASLMLTMGTLGDLFGRKKVMLAGVVVFCAGSILCALAPIFGQMFDVSFLGAVGVDTSSPGLIFLIAARLIQAIGGGAIVPVAMAIAGDFYGQERRGLALGVIGAVTEAGGAIGPLYGAIITQQFGWQAIFYLNVPIVIVLLVVAFILIPKGKRLYERIDWIGALLLGLALTCLSLGLAQQGADLGPPSPTGVTPQNNPIALALAVLFLIAFVLVEWKVRFPVINLSLFKRLPFTATAFVSLLVGCALIIAMADIPIFVDTVLNRPVLDSGLALLRLTAMIPPGALLGGWLCNRITCRYTSVLGLLFTATGFYLMSRWPMNVDWNQITVSTLTTGFGFGLVIAPIGTTTINAVRAREAGMGSSIVTALRMVGMILGLAALTSWALAYFKQLASAYPSLPLSATTAQFAQWAKGYAAHLIVSAHTVYSAVFFFSMVICLIAVVPAFFLWGRKATVAEVEPEEVPDEIIAPAPHEAQTVSADPLGTGISLAAADILLDPSVLQTQPGEPPLPPTDNGGNGGNGGRSPKRKRRRLIIALASLLLVLLLIIGGVIAAFTWQGPDTTGVTGGSTPTTTAATPTSTPISGPRMIQLALDKGALTSLFTSQLGLKGGALTDLSVFPTPGDGLVLSLNLHIDSSGIHRVIPVELDTVLGLDKQQNIQLTIQHLKRNGIDASSASAATMQQGLNQLLANSLMPALRGELKSVKLLSIHTSSTIGCDKGAEMLVLLIQAPAVQGIAAQPTPVPFCFKGNIDITKLLP